MTNFGNFLIFVGLVVCSLVNISTGAAVEYTDDYKIFFKNLNPGEQQALIALAIAHHDVPTHRKPGTYPITPLVNPKPEEIPATLFSAMMNGEVPSRWMKEFIEWTRQEYGFTDQSFNSFRSNASAQEVCNPETRVCTRLTDLGAQCCPFG